MTPTPAGRERLKVVAADLGLYLVVLAAVDWLRFAPRKDELHFWPTTQLFAQAFPPSLELLRGYDEINTPLPFILFGLLEHVFHGGIAVARAVNLALSLLLVLAVQLDAGGPTRRSLLASLGLLLCPYFLGTATHLYTELWTLTFVFFGMRCYGRGQGVAAAVLLALAVSCRQYAIAFPAGIVLAALVPSSGTPLRSRLASAWPALPAFVVLAGWIALFGGLAPLPALSHRIDGGVPLRHVFPDHAVYFLAAVGCYYVLPELVLLPDARSTMREHARERFAPLAVVAVVIGFCVWPPLRNPEGYGFPEMGFLDKALRGALSDGLRVAVLAALGALTVLRFARLDLLAVSVFANAAVMLKAAIAWDKYCLPLLVVLWWSAAHRRNPVHPIRT